MDVALRQNVDAGYFAVTIAVQLPQHRHQEILHMKRILAAVAAAALAMFAGTADAAVVDSTDINITATVAATCSFDAASYAIAIAYDPASATTGSTTVEFTCTKGAAPTFSFLNGLHFAAGTRNLAAGAEVIPYDIAAGAIAGPSGSLQSVPVTASIAAGFWVPAGSYTDTVVMDVNL